MKKRTKQAGIRAAFGALLVSLREARGWDRATTAQYLGTSQRHLRRWESGQCFPRDEYIEALARLHGHTSVSLVAMLGQDEAA